MRMTDSSQQVMYTAVNQKPDRASDEMADEDQHLRLSSELHRESSMGKVVSETGGISNIKQSASQCRAGSELLPTGCLTSVLSGSQVAFGY